jgi:chemotaxis protein methyltransferase CheR
LNLLEDFSALGRFDVIFCRNVLIYFQVSTKKDILDRMSRTLQPDGFLMMGAAETVIGITKTFRRVSEYRAAIYAPSDSTQPLGIRTDSEQLSALTNSPRGMAASTPTKKVI